MVQDLAELNRELVLNLAQAYEQLPVDEATAEAQTIVTHRGAFRVKRLQFGVSVALGIFQNLMDSLLKGRRGSCHSSMTC